MAFQKGHIPWNKGKKGWTKETKAGFKKEHLNYLKCHSEKTKRKISEGRKGKNNPNWRGGKRKYYCEYCGKIFYKYPTEKRLYCSNECANFLVLIEEKK